LVRAEVDRLNSANPLARLLNRVWVLVPLLALCIGVILWSFWPLSMQTLYTRGAALMSSDRLADKQEAWRDYLAPLNERFPDHPYHAEVDKFRRLLEAAESTKPTEAQRFFQQGDRLRQEGDFEGARRVWQNTIAVFGDIDSEQEGVRRAARALTELEKNAAAPDRWLALKPVLDRAAKLRDQGKRAEAEKIWSGLEELYRNDPWAKDLLKQVAAARAE
jgi:tetratricopeptide (TPR) repeat protein